jgi:hypothetical protein
VVVLGRIVELSFGAAYPLKKREKLGEVPAIYSPDDVYIPRTLLRGADVLAITMFLGKNYLVKTPSK